MRIGTVVVALVGVITCIMATVLGRPVYWAVYARMYPMKSGPVTVYEHGLEPSQLRSSGHRMGTVHGGDVEMDEPVDGEVMEEDPSEDPPEDSDDHATGDDHGEPETLVFKSNPSPPPPPPSPSPPNPPPPEEIEEEHYPVAVIEDDEPPPSAPDSSGLGLSAGYADLPSGPVNPDDYKLSVSRVKRIVASKPQYKMIMVTWANFHYLDFVMNWVTHLRVLGVSNFIVGAMDKPMLDALVERRVSTFLMSSGLTTGDFGWGTKTFHKMGREKIALIQRFTEMGFDILLSDVDTVWQRDPNVYMNQYMDADVLTSSDHLSETVVDGGLEKWPQANSAANIGIMLFRHTAHSLAKAWVQALVRDPLYWDQNAFNDLMRRGGSRDVNAKRLFLGFDGKTRIGILPVTLFCSGHSYFATRMPERHSLTPYVIHATFQYSGTEGKRHRFREARLWHDPPEYYNPKGGLLVYRPDVPPDMVKKAIAPFGRLDVKNVAGHFVLANYQMKQIRNALAIAQALGRTLVMPRMVCAFDRWWAPHHGKIPGSSTKVPVDPCPMDHVFEIEAWLRPYPEHDHGKNIAFREYSMLTNPRTPDRVKGDQVIVQICPPGGSCDGDPVLSRDAPLPIGAGRPRVEKLPGGLKDTQIRKALMKHQGVKVLHFSTMVGAFGGFSNGKDLENLMRRTKHFVSLWCCVHAHPGHIWYDFWPDLKHTDRHNRLWDPAVKPWKPVTGP